MSNKEIKRTGTLKRKRGTAEQIAQLDRIAKVAEDEERKHLEAYGQSVRKR